MEVGIGKGTLGEDRPLQIGPAEISTLAAAPAKEVLLRA